MEDLSFLPLSPETCDELARFCSPLSNRYEILCRSLERRGIPFETIPIAGSRHLSVRTPGNPVLDDGCYRVALVAHYDRMPGTPGANDNAAAVFQLLEFREHMRREGARHQVQILFTDREELTGDMKPTDQGAWALGHSFKRLGVDNLLFFVLDMCGIGDTPVWGRSSRKAGLFETDAALARIHRSMEEFLKDRCGGRDFGSNPMFSDDLGLLLSGYPALQISLLPRREAENLTRRLGPSPGLPEGMSPADARKAMAHMLPPSWRNNHGPDDGPLTLQARSFIHMNRLLRDIVRFRFPLPAADC